MDADAEAKQFYGSIPRKGLLVCPRYLASVTWNALTGVDIYTSDTSFHKKCKVEDIKVLCIKVIELFVDQLAHYRYKMYFSVPILFGFMIK